VSSRARPGRPRRHGRWLAALLILVVLVDTDGINPEGTGRGGRAEGVEGLGEVLPHRERGDASGTGIDTSFGAVIDDSGDDAKEVMGAGVAPRIRNCFVGTRFLVHAGLQQRAS
jgi:hypothetical protein